MSASPGERPNLSASIEEIAGKCRNVPVGEYKESLCSAIKEKGVTKYYGEQSSGYKGYMGAGSGFVIGVSMAKINFFNQAMNITNDISCLFGMSALKIPIIKAADSTREMGEPYYDYQPEFSKTNGASIESGYFTNNKFSHISAVLISNHGQDFYPDMDKIDQSCVWKGVRNGFTLIHNPYAAVPLPYGIFAVKREVTAIIEEDHIEVKIDKK